MSHRLEDPEYVSAHLRELFATNGRVNELAVEVSVQGSTIVLRGPVATPERQVAMTELARERYPRYEVVNETRVPGMRTTEEPEELS